jgi:enoyl-[acyl-carrier protein] reductase II
MKTTPICKLLGIQYPIIQAGMVYVSGAKLAAASANAGCLGVIGAGSMSLELLDSQLKKAKSLTDKPLAINLPLFFSKVEDQIKIALENDIKIFITSAGSPKKYTSYLKERGCIVIHVTATPEQALKCEKAGVDAVIVEGFEAGGHNGPSELTSLVLLPKTVDTCTIPIIAAGGFSSGKSVLAALCMGAQAVQMGTRFMMTSESSAHQNYKDELLRAGSDSTKLMLKSIGPVRLLKNDFYFEVEKAENQCASEDELKSLLGKGRARSGMLDGDIVSGELETGQICYAIEDLPTVEKLMRTIVNEYDLALKKFLN